jgi:hypothetical protein
MLLHQHQDAQYVEPPSEKQPVHCVAVEDLYTAEKENSVECSNISQIISQPNNCSCHPKKGKRCTGQAYLLSSSKSLRPEMLTAWARKFLLKHKPVELLPV